MPLTTFYGNQKQPLIRCSALVLLEETCCHFLTQKNTKLLIRGKSETFKTLFGMYISSGFKFNIEEGHQY